MSDSPPKSGFRRWLKPGGVVLLIATTSAIAGFAASSFLNKKSFKQEANHSTAKEDHSDDTEKMSSENTSGDKAHGNPHSESSGPHDHTANSSDHVPEADHGHVQHDSGHALALTPDEATDGHKTSADSHDAHLAADDPFSDAALDLEWELKPLASADHDHATDELTDPAHPKNPSGDEHDSAHAHADVDSPGHSEDDSAVPIDLWGGDQLAADDHDSHANTAQNAEVESQTHHESGHDEESGDHTKTAEPDASHGADVSADHAPATTAVTEKTTRQDRITQQAVNYMSMADEELATGNYVEAMRAYQALRKKADGAPGPALLFRLALCAEAAGRHAAAMEAYRRISGTQTDPAWTGVARYGESRCLVATKRHQGLQSDLLRRAILDETELLPTVRGEILHLIGRDLWREQTAMNNSDLLQDTSLVVPEWSADPIRLLEELPLLIHETPVERSPAQFQVLSMEESRPEGIKVRLSCNLMRLDTLMTKLMTGCRLRIKISDSAMEVIEGRSQHVMVRDSNLALLLDGLTIPWGLTWTFTNETVHIVHPSELPDEVVRSNRLNAAERILRIAVMEGADSVQIGHSRLALSTLLFEQKRAADAVQFLQLQIETAPRSVVAAEAGFNLGKCLMVLNERTDAKLAFLKSIDASGGPVDVKVASYIFHCRMLLEEGHHQQAITTMMRGLALSEGSEMESWASLQLASAYLLKNVPQGANSVLMNHTDSFAEGDAKAAGAFASALSRFRAAVLADRREREGADVVAALAEFNAADACGGHWAVLVAGACEELGLTQQAGEAYDFALKRLPECVLRDATTMKLAEHYKQQNEPEQARLLLTSLTASQAGELASEAKLETAQLALEQSRLKDAVKISRELFVSTKSRPMQRAALGIMGKAYERQGNHEAAIYCFSGSLPDDDSRKDVERKSPGSHGVHR